MMQYRNNNLKTSISRVNYLYHIIHNRLRGRLKPVIAVLVVNTTCNLNCAYCSGDYQRGSKKGNFTTEELINIIDELYKMGARALTVHGGETLLRKDIGYLVNYIKNKGFYINFVTNGLLLPGKIEEIRCIDSLCISLDGNEEGNDLNRGKGTHKKILDAIKLAKQKGFRLRVQATITRHTTGDIEYLARLAKETGFELEFSLMYRRLGRDISSLSIDDDQTKRVLREITYFKKKGYPIFTSFAALENALNWPFPYSRSKLFCHDLCELPKNFRKIDCYYGKTKIVIDSDGYVYPCFSMNTEFKGLNLKEVGIKKAYRHVLENNTCAACNYLTNNDHNLLLGLSPREIFAIGKRQIKEIFNLY